MDLNGATAHYHSLIFCPFNRGSVPFFIKRGAQRDKVFEAILVLRAVEGGKDFSLDASGSSRDS